MFIRNSEQLFKIIFGHGLVPLLRAAKLAAMQDAINAALHTHGNGLHPSPALGQAVAGIDVYVATIEAARTMICVAAALDSKAAVQTNKVLDLTLKATAHVPMLQHSARPWL